MNCYPFLCLSLLVSVCVTARVCLCHRPDLFLLLAVSVCVTVTGLVCVRLWPGLSVPPAMSIHVTGRVCLCHLLCLGHLGHVDPHTLAHLICSACNDWQGQPATSVLFIHTSKMCLHLGSGACTQS